MSVSARSLLGLLCVCRMATCSPPPAVPGLAQYSAYIQQYDKAYTQDQFWEHFATFTDNLAYIEASNAAPSKSYKMGVNAFTDITRGEFAASHLSNRMTPRGTSHWNVVSRPLAPGWPGKGMPQAIDWRASGWVTDIKDQGQCGSCWAFSAVGAIEGQHANATGQLTSFSEQNLVDCAYDYGCEGCDGGWPEAAMRYVADNKGLDTEGSYPYSGSDGSCAYQKNQSGGTVTGTVNVTSGDMGALYGAIATVGPISVAIDAESDFQFYASGVFSSTTCSSQFLDHAVLAIGYGVSPSKQKYIIVKNSWGTDWGMDGYIYMASDTPNMCGIASCASYPIVTPKTAHLRIESL
jgi:cathepsin L